jgi:hypothetical protein
MGFLPHVFLFFWLPFMRPGLFVCIMRHFTLLSFKPPLLFPYSFAFCPVFSVSFYCFCFSVWDEYILVFLDGREAVDAVGRSPANGEKHYALKLVYGLCDLKCKDLVCELTYDSGLFIAKGLAISAALEGGRVLLYASSSLQPWVEVHK